MPDRKDSFENPEAKEKQYSELFEVENKEEQEVRRVQRPHLDDDYNSRSKDPDYNEFIYRPLRERQADLGQLAGKQEKQRQKSQAKRKQTVERKVTSKTLNTQKTQDQGFNLDAYYDDKLYDAMRQQSLEEQRQASARSVLDSFKELRAQRQLERAEEKRRQEEAKQQAEAERLAQEEAERMAAEEEAERLRSVNAIEQARKAAEAEALQLVDDQAESPEDQPQAVPADQVEVESDSQETDTNDYELEMEAEPKEVWNAEDEISDWEEDLAQDEIDGEEVQSLETDLGEEMSYMAQAEFDQGIDEDSLGEDSLGVELTDSMADSLDSDYEMTMDEEESNSNNPSFLDNLRSFFRPKNQAGDEVADNSTADTEAVIDEFDEADLVAEATVLVSDSTAEEVPAEVDHDQVADIESDADSQSDSKNQEQKPNLFQTLKIRLQAHDEPEDANQAQTPSLVDAFRSQLIKEDREEAIDWRDIEDPEDIVALSDTLAKDASRVKQIIIEDQAVTSNFDQTAKLSRDLIDQALAEQAASESEDLESEEDDVADDSQQVVRGAAWLTVASILSRILGIVYIIPWAAWLGADYNQAATLYSVGYRPYALFLSIATAGFPSSIAKQLAFYQSKKEYGIADRLFKASALIMIATGFISGLILYLSAPALANATPTAYPESAIQVIRSLVPALLILPIMSLFRGYFQGFNEMKPSAVSQVIEQLVRVAYILGATYAILRVYNGTVTQAVVHTTFAAFIGAVASFIYLLILFLMRRRVVKNLIVRSANAIEIDFKESLKIMIKDSIPFILLGSGIIIMQNIDTISFKQILIRTSTLLTVEIDVLYGALSVNVDKLVMIIVSVAVALSTSLVPVVTSRYGQGDKEGTRAIVHQVLLVLAFINLPAALGMIAIGKNLYNFFYSSLTQWEYRLLVTGALSSIVLGLYTVLSMILQSMNYRRLAVRFLLIGIIIKLILQFPLVALFQAHGTFLATVIGLGVTSALMMVKINRELRLNWGYLNDNLFKIAVASIVMFVGALLWDRVLNYFFPSVGRSALFIKIVLVVIFAVVIYGGLMALMGMLRIIMGDRYKRIQERLSL